MKNTAFVRYIHDNFRKAAMLTAIIAFASFFLSATINAQPHTKLLSDQAKMSNLMDTQPERLAMMLNDLQVGE